MTNQEIITDIEKKLKEAMRNKDSITLETMRSIKTNITYWQKVNIGKDVEMIQILNMMAKQRRQSIEEYIKGNIQELANKEKAELNLIEIYLPKALTEAEALVEMVKIINDNVITSVKDMGKIIKEFNNKFPGQFDGKRLSELIKAHLI